ncbi:L-lactate permease, partial [Corynebacterium flavescens]
GHQTPLLAFIVPLFLVFLADGKRGLRETWPIALVIGIVFAITQWVSATWISVELTDIIASLCGLAAAVIMLRFWQPKGGDEARERLRAEAGENETPARATGTLTAARTWMALFPYLLVIVIFSVAKLFPPAVEFLSASDVKIQWPGLHGNIVNSDGEIVTSTIYSLSWLSSPGTLLLICGVIIAIVYRVGFSDSASIYGKNLVKMRFSILTVASVLALAYVMNQSGQTITIGHWIAGTGAAFAFLSPILGWLGTAVTGSDTSANALFATLQQAAAERVGIDPTLLVAANTSGGVVGKMISPQNLTIAATAVGLVNKESEIFRKVIWWSLGLLAAMCLIVGLQSNILAWMLP